MARRAPQHKGADILGVNGRSVLDFLLRHLPGKLTVDGTEVESRHLQLGAHGGHRLARSLTVNGTLALGQARHDISKFDGRQTMKAFCKSNLLLAQSNLCWRSDAMVINPQIGAACASGDFESFEDSDDGLAATEKYRTTRIGIAPGLIGTWPERTLRFPF